MRAIGAFKPLSPSRAKCERYVLPASGKRPSVSFTSIVGSKFLRTIDRPLQFLLILLGKDCAATSRVEISLTVSGQRHLFKRR